MDSLSDEEWDRVVIVVDRLAALGPLARMPLSRALGDGLFELRFALGPTARRMTYRFTKDGRIVLLTTFRKQRNNATRSTEHAVQPPTAPLGTREGGHDGEPFPLGRNQARA
jgi:phage-related protein